MSYEPQGEQPFLFDYETEPALRPDVDDSTQGVLTRLLVEARNHYDDDLEPEQAEATDFYHGRPFGDEKDGRSKAVSSDLRDVTLGQLPELIRIFMGPENMLEFTPNSERTVEVAEQQTDFLDHVVWNDNTGFATILGWLQDGLIRKIGAVKYYWDETQRLVEDQYTGLTHPQLITLVEDEEVEDFEFDDVRFEKKWNAEVYDVTVQRWTTGGVARFEGVPNEEFLFTPKSRTLHKSQVVAHSREVPVSEVVALGYDRDELESFIGETERMGSEDLGNARQFDGGDGNHFSPREGDRSQRPILFTEAYAWVDADGDGISELRKFCCVGPQYKILPDPGTERTDGVAVERAPFAVFAPYPEAHAIVGLSNHDLTKDIQRIKSQLLRALLDTSGQATDAQMEVVHGEVNMGDVLKPDVNKIIRVRKPGMIREVRHTFVGGEMISALEYVDQVRAERTGHTRAEQGLDPDALQSSTREAVLNTLSKGQARIYMVAQVFAETALKDLFVGLHELVVKHQDYARTVRLRGKFVEVDPRHWGARLDLRVNVALGSGTATERAAVLESVIARQEMYIEKGVPFVNFTNLRRALERATKLLGYQDPTEFWGTWGDQEQQAYDQAKAENPPSDPAQELVETEKMKIQQEHIHKQDELDLKRTEMTLRDQRERRANELKEYEIELKYMVALQDQETTAGVQLATARMKAAPRETAA